MRWPDDGLEMWERDGYAEAMYEKADNDRKALKENGEANSPKSGEVRKDSATLIASRRHDELFRLLSIPTRGPEARAAWRAFIDEVGKDRRTLRIAHRIATHGAGPGTTAEQALATIATFIENRVTDE